MRPEPPRGNFGEMAAVTACSRPSQTIARRTLLILAMLMAGLAGCKIVKNGTSDKTDPQKPDSFDAKAYVDTLWSSKILPFFASGAHDLAPVLSGTAKDLMPRTDNTGNRRLPTAAPGPSPLRAWEGSPPPTSSRRTER